jgi:hypothetical protein
MADDRSVDIHAIPMRSDVVVFPVHWRVPSCVGDSLTV